ncbi:MAG: hypothetical protein H7Z72_13045 [Bacteroidetes bacterium]|nr:hypothetical protein [Fibrella sp.]
MFTIQQGQMDAFDTNARARFLDEAAIVLKAEHTDHRSTVPDPVVRREVEKIAVIAESFGIRSLDNIALFLNVANDIGWDFYDVFDPPHEVLNSKELDEDTKSIWLAQWYISMLTPEGGWESEKQRT